MVISCICITNMIVQIYLPPLNNNKINVSIVIFIYLNLNSNCISLTIFQEFTFIIIWFYSIPYTKKE